MSNSQARSGKRKRGETGGKQKGKGARNKEQRYNCDYCNKDLSTSVRIKCAECADFDLCLECFAVGAEIVPHKNTHAYRVVDNLSPPVYTLDWGADEETLLLEGVEHYGLGNWTQIGHHVGKGPDDCKDHYFKVYVETESFPRPQKSEGLKSVNMRKLIDDKRKAGAKRIAMAKQAAISGKGGQKGIVSPVKPEEDVEEKKEETPTLTAVEEGSGIAVTGQKTAPAAAAQDGQGGASLAESQISGYNVKRNEFDVEYDHEAEHLIAELDFGEDDSEEEIAHKLRLIDIYNRRLDEREKRKDFVLSRGLVKVKRQQLIDRRRSVHEREILSRLRVFCRYMPHPQWESLTDGLAIEARLRARISELKHYRSLGMRTFEELDSYVETMGAPKKESSINNQPGRSKLQRILIDTCALERELMATGNQQSAALVHEQHAMVPEGKGVNGLQAWRAKRGILLDLTSLPDVELLTQEERRLCASERYLPAQYLAVKTEIMKKQHENGVVSKNDILSLPFAVDAERSLRLLDFFKHSGWIKVGRGQKNAT